MLSALSAHTHVLSGHGYYMPFRNFQKGDLVVTKGGRLAKVTHIEEGGLADGYKIKTRRWHSQHIMLTNQRVACTDRSWETIEPLISSTQKVLLGVPDVKRNPVVKFAIKEQHMDLQYNFASGYIVGTYLCIGNKNTLSFSNIHLIEQFLFYFKKTYPHHQITIHDKNFVRLDDHVIDILTSVTKDTSWIAAGYSMDPMFLMGVQTGLTEHMRYNMHINLTTHMYEVLLITNMLLHPWDSLEHHNKLVEHESNKVLTPTCLYRLDHNDAILVAENMWVCGELMTI